MSLVMLGKEQWRQSGGATSADRGQFAREQRFEVELFLEPQRHRGQKRLQSLRREAQVSLQHPLELDPGLIVKDHLVDSGEPHPRLTQAIGDRISRKAGVVFLAREALLLRGCDDLAIIDQRGSTIVVISGNSE